MGDSAGGGLAAGVCLLARDRSGPAVAQQLLIYPMLDDRPVPPDPALQGFLTWTYDDNLTGWGALLGDEAGGATSRRTRRRPAPTDLPGLPDTYIDVGDLDIFRDEDISYASRLSDARRADRAPSASWLSTCVRSAGGRADVSSRTLSDRIRRLRPSLTGNDQLSDCSIYRSGVMACAQWRVMRAKGMSSGVSAAKRWELSASASPS